MFNIQHFFSDSHNQLFIQLLIKENNLEINCFRSDAEFNLQSN